MSASVSVSVSVSDPSFDERELAVAKAVGARRGIHRSNPAHDDLSNAAIAERVRGRLVPLEAGRDGWWLVGRLVDEIEEAEFSVWFMKEARRIGLSRIG